MRHIVEWLFRSLQNEPNNWIKLETNAVIGGWLNWIESGRCGYGGWLPSGFQKRPSFCRIEGNGWGVRCCRPVQSVFRLRAGRRHHRRLSKANSVVENQGISFHWPFQIVKFISSRNMTDDKSSLTRPMSNVMLSNLNWVSIEFLTAEKQGNGLDILRRG